MARQADELASALRRRAIAYLAAGHDSRRRADIFARLQADQARVRMLPDTYRTELSRQDDLTALLGRAHAEHAATEGPARVVPGLRREFEAARCPQVRAIRHATIDKEK